MGKETGRRNIFEARRHIREFAQEYSKQCGRSPAYIEKDIIAAKKLNHISLGEYAWIGYSELNDEQKRSVSTLWTRAEFRKTYTDRRYICLLMNKFIFSRVFSDFYGRRCEMAEGLDKATLAQLAANTGKVVYKPNCKGQGKGVCVLNIADDAQLAAAYDFVQNNSDGIVEEYIVQHETLARLNPSAVSIIRFYTVCAPSGSYLFAPVLTTAITKEISNGCQDALTAMIDIRTGEVVTDAVDQNNFAEYAEHPVTGVRFKGLKMPYWEETIAMMRRAVPLAKKISNIGWDIAVAADGPLIIEANTIPGFNTAQYRGYAELTGGYGYQPLFDEINGKPFTPDSRYDKVLIKLD